MPARTVCTQTPRDAELAHVHGSPDPPRSDGRSIIPADASGACHAEATWPTAPAGLRPEHDHVVAAAAASTANPAQVGADACENSVPASATAGRVPRRPHPVFPGLPNPRTRRARLSQPPPPPREAAQSQRARDAIRPTRGWMAFPGDESVTSSSSRTPLLSLPGHSGQLRQRESCAASARAGGALRMHHKARPQQHPARAP
jgi:hypothetical protein